MKVIESTFNFLYRLMLRCYPEAVRAEFGDEMIEVYTEATHSVSREGLSNLAVVFFRELRDWPNALLQAYRSVFRHRARRLDLKPNPRLMFFPASRESELSMGSQDGYFKVTKRQAAVMALPLLLLGLGIMLSASIRTDVWYRLPTWQLYLSAGTLLVSGFVVGVVGLIGLLKRLPDWALTWVGCTFMGVTLSTQVVLGELADDGVLILPPTIETALAFLFFLIGLMLLVSIAKRGLEHAGLFTSAVAGTMGLSLLQAVTAAPFNRDDIALLAGPLGFVLAFMVFTYILRPGRARWAIIGGIGLLNGGIVLVATKAWSTWIEDAGAGSPVLPLLVILTGLLLSGPISGLLLKPILGRKIF